MVPDHDKIWVKLHPGAHVYSRVHYSIGSQLRSVGVQHSKGLVCSSILDLLDIFYYYSERQMQVLKGSLVLVGQK